MKETHMQERKIVAFAKKYILVKIHSANNEPRKDNK